MIGISTSKILHTSLRRLRCRYRPLLQGALTALMIVFPLLAALASLTASVILPSAADQGLQDLVFALIFFHAGCAILFIGLRTADWTRLLRRKNSLAALSRVDLIDPPDLVRQLDDLAGRSKHISILDLWGMVRYLDAARFPSADAWPTAGYRYLAVDLKPRDLQKLENLRRRAAKTDRALHCHVDQSPFFFSSLAFCVAESESGVFSVLLIRKTDDPQGFRPIAIHDRRLGRFFRDEFNKLWQTLPGLASQQGGRHDVT